MFRNGEGVAKDRAEDIRLYRLAAAQGQAYVTSAAHWSDWESPSESPYKCSCTSQRFFTNRNVSFEGSGLARLQSCLDISSSECVRPLKCDQSNFTHATVKSTRERGPGGGGEGYFMNYALSVLQTFQQ